MAALKASEWVKGQLVTKGFEETDTVLGLRKGRTYKTSTVLGWVAKAACDQLSGQPPNVFYPCKLEMFKNAGLYSAASLQRRSLLSSFLTVFLNLANGRWHWTVPVPSWACFSNLLYTTVSLLQEEMCGQWYLLGWRRELSCLVTWMTLHYGSEFAQASVLLHCHCNLQ